MKIESKVKISRDGLSDKVERNEHILRKQR